MKSRARRFVEMVVLGSLLFAAERAITSEAAPDALPLTVVVPADATPAERERRVEDAVLLAEAVRRDLLRHDPFVQHRIAANLAALDGAHEDDPEALLARAVALGMVARDPLLRAHLLRRMRARGDVSTLLARYAPSVRTRAEDW